MRTILELDDEWLAWAQQLSGLTERTELIRESLLALAQRESTRRLASLGDTELAARSPAPGADSALTRASCKTFI